MKQNSLAVADYESQIDAETAIKELKKSGFDVRKLSILSRDDQTDESEIGCRKASDRMKFWTKNGPFWGGIWKRDCPGVGLLLFAGPAIGWISGALNGSVIVDGLSPLGAGLVSVGLPENGALQYEAAVRSDRSVVIAHGTEKTVAHAYSILIGTKTQTVAEYPAAIDCPAP